MKKTHRKFFTNRKCNICKKPATLYRYIDSKRWGYLCDDYGCQNKFNIRNKIKNENSTFDGIEEVL